MSHLGSSPLSQQGPRFLFNCCGIIIIIGNGMTHCSLVLFLKLGKANSNTQFASLLCKPQTRPPQLQQWSPHLLWCFRAGLQVCCISACWGSTRPSWGGIHYCPIASSSQETTFNAQAGAVWCPHWCSTCPSVPEGTNSEHGLDYPEDRLNVCS